MDTHPLPMDLFDTAEFAEILTLAIANRIGIGNLLADGTVRFAEKIGRIGDTHGILRFPAWGYVDHWTMPTVEQWKTAFYGVEGWDSRTGYPKSDTLGKLGLRHVAEVLRKNGKLG